MLERLLKPYFLGATSMMGEEMTTYIFGIGENWWKEWVRPWKENVKGNECGL